jgi:hypothetical protein
VRERRLDPVDRARAARAARAGAAAARSAICLPSAMAAGRTEAEEPVITRVLPSRAITREPVAGARGARTGWQAGSQAEGNVGRGRRSGRGRELP